MTAASLQFDVHRRAAATSEPATEVTETTEDRTGEAALHWQCSLTRLSADSESSVPSVAKWFEAGSWRSQSKKPEAIRQRPSPGDPNRTAASGEPKENTAGCRGSRGSLERSALHPAAVLSRCPCRGRESRGRIAPGTKTLVSWGEGGAVRFGEGEPPPEVPHENARWQERRPAGPRSAKSRIFCRWEITSMPSSAAKSPVEPEGRVASGHPVRGSLCPQGSSGAAETARSSGCWRRAGSTRRR